MKKFIAISVPAQDAIIMMDDEGNISRWNEAAERIFGYSRKEAVGNRVRELIMPPSISFCTYRRIKEI